MLKTTISISLLIFLSGCGGGSTDEDESNTSIPVEYVIGGNQNPSSRGNPSMTIMPVNCEANPEICK